MYFQNKSRRAPEQQIQLAVFQHLRARGSPGCFYFHCPNGGYRRRVEAMLLKGLGVVAGVPDIIAIHQGRCYALELKAPGRRATEKQIAVMGALERAGALTAVAEGLDRALAVLEGWGLLKGKSQIGIERHLCGCGKRISAPGREVCFKCFCHQQEGRVS